MSNLAQRILFAAPAAAGFLTLAWLGDWYFLALMFVIAIFTQFEVLSISRKAGLPGNTPFVLLATVWVFMYDWIPDPLLVAGGLLLTLTILSIFDGRHQALFRLVSSPFYGLYASVGLASLVWIRQLGSDETGIALIFGLMMMVWGNDVFAYFGGRFLGSHKLAPAISPGKTVEGFLFGFLGGAVGLGLIIWLLPFPFPLSIADSVPLVLLNGVFGPIGDLTESRFKRMASVKDSSNLLPGHGGFFDRFDALILTAPAVYIYLKFLAEYTGF